MKERLTGAIILVALIVLLVPELLTGPVRSSTAPQTAATSPEEPPLRSYTINLADDTRTTRSAPSVGGATAGEGAAQPAPQANPSGVTDGAPPEPAEPLAGSGAGSGPEDGAPGASSAGGAGAAPTGAPSAGGARTAPTGASPSAGGALTAPAAATSPTPTHSSHPKPPRTTPEPGEGSAAHGWMVQVGVFASRENAERLAQELKGKGFRISVTETAGTHRKLFRVRAGPVTDRTAASDLAAKLRAAGAPGSVVPRT